MVMIVMLVVTVTVLVVTLFPALHKPLSQPQWKKPREGGTGRILRKGSGRGSEVLACGPGHSSTCTVVDSSSEGLFHK